MSTEIMIKNFAKFLNNDEKSAIVEERVKKELSVPTLQLETNEYRRGPSLKMKETFRSQVTTQFRKVWKNQATEEKFNKLAKVLDEHGCAIFGGLVSIDRFKLLIEAYSAILNGSGNRTFLHSYVNMADHATFLCDDNFNDAFAHPLLIALIAFIMGGAVRISDVRGKDTGPISANAQDNMLHVDNTPFREEYKVLLGWRKGSPEGPCGQNFTFLPGTHKGNRNILIDDYGRPWSTERDSLFVSETAIDKLFAFQEKVTSHSPTVVEAFNSSQPVTITFAASALVHHRYRTEHGSPRSCIIAAFHVYDDDPGVLIPNFYPCKENMSLVHHLIGYRGEDYTSIFISLLTDQAKQIEAKIEEIYDSITESCIIDFRELSLKPDQIVRWRKDVVEAPYASSIKYAREIYHLTDKVINNAGSIDILASVMIYDMHGLLQLILYEDGHEEIRKPMRKKIGEASQAFLVARLTSWMPVLKHEFSVKDLPSPQILRNMMEVTEDVAREELAGLYLEPNRKLLYTDLVSLTQLLHDLGEAITRCELTETYVSTSLYMFWAVDQLIENFKLGRKEVLHEVGVSLLRNYVASVLLLESFTPKGENL